MHAEIHSYTDICTYIQYADTHTFTYMHGCIHAETKKAGDDVFGDLLLTGLLSVEKIMRPILCIQSTDGHAVHICDAW